MPYVAATVKDLRTRYPAFAGVDDAVILSALAEAVRNVDESWLEGDFTLAQLLYAAHVMTLDGFGTGIQAELAPQILMGFTAVRSGNFSMSRGQISGESSAFTESFFGATTYGQRFFRLLRQNFRGPRLVTGP